MKKILYTLLLAMPLCAEAQVPQLLKDINTQPGSNNSGFPDYYAVMNGKLYFTAMSDLQSELWRTDGTTAGTQMIIGALSGNTNESMSDLTAFGNQLLFTAETNAEGAELWISDGTTAGSHLVLDINPGTAASTPHGFTLFNNKMYFIANDGTHGNELWVTDGTAANTHMVIDLWSGPYDGAEADMFIYNNQLYFTGTNTPPTQGLKLWYTDGTAAGTQLSPSNAPHFGGSCIFNGKIYFSGDDGLHGTEPWVTDGTAAGTYMIKDINTISTNPSSSPGSFIGCNGHLYFIASDGLSGSANNIWTSDGTAAGTTKVSTANVTSTMLTMNNKLYFRAYDLLLNDELWKSDGTSAGTHVVKEINPSGGSNPITMSVYNNRVYFAANDGSSAGSGGYHYELWASDGTDSGTVKIQPAVVTDPDPLFEGYFPFIVYDSTFYYSVSYDPTNTGRECYWFKDTAHHTDSVIADTTTNVQTVRSTRSIQVSPNPAHTVLNITGIDAGNISVFDIAGRKTDNLQIPNNKTIDITKLADGVYFLRDEKGGFIKKIIKN